VHQSKFNRFAEQANLQISMSCSDVLDLCFAGRIEAIGISTWEPET
jgi:hypothetical protein